MKKIIFFGLMLLLFVGCKKEQVELKFDAQPEERMGERLNELRTLLTSSENGWKAVLPLNLPGGFSFYFDFEDGKMVNMVSDFTNETASVPKKSTYRVHWAMNAALVFDTFNYITMLQEPSATYGGVSPNGYFSDVEFEFLRTSGDSVFFKGKKYEKPLILIKASKTEKDGFLGDTFSKSISKTKEFFTKNEYSYISLDSAGQNYMVGVDLLTNTKILSLTTILKDGKTSSKSSPFIFNLDAIELTPFSVTFLGVEFVKATWEGSKLLLIDKAGKKYEIKNHTQPIIPLFKALGSKYIGVLSPYQTFFPGTSAAGLEILKRFHDGLGNRATGYFFNNGNIKMTWDSFNQRITLIGFSSQNNGASGWNTTTVYNYEIEEDTGIYKLTKRSNATGGYTAPILDKFDDFLLNSRFTMEYFVDAGVLYAKMKGVERSAVEMTFQLN